MNRILNGLNRLVSWLMGPLAVGVVIIVLYLWLVKPLLFAGVIGLFVFVLLLGVSKALR